MTREEAVKILKTQLDVTAVNAPSCIALHEALDLAIEALSESEIMRCKDCRHNNNCDIQFAATAGENFGCLAGERSEYVEPKGDYEFFGGEYAKEGDAESATTTDCISRQAAIKEIKNATTITGWNKYASQEEIVDDVERQLRRLFVGAIESLPPVTPTEQNEEDILKFYYVESLDEYWIGQRCGTRYYGKWTGNCFTYGYSRYLPWGEHVVAPDTLWKEHTYPSEPKEIPFNKWLQGFLQRECQPKRPKTTETMMVDGEPTEIDPLSYEVGYTHGQFSKRPNGEWIVDSTELKLTCSECKATYSFDDVDELLDFKEDAKFCIECGAKMKGEDDE